MNVICESVSDLKNSGWTPDPHPPHDVPRGESPSSGVFVYCQLPHFLVNPDAVVNLCCSFAEVSMEVNEKWMEGKATV